MKKKRFLTLFLIVIIIYGCAKKTPVPNELLVVEEQGPLIEEQRANKTAGEPIQITTERDINQAAENIASKAEQSWTQRRVPCSDKLFDTHAHFDGLVQVVGHENSLTPKELAERMTEHNVGCAILFVSIDDLNMKYDSMRESMSGLNAGFLPSMSVFGISGNMPYLSLDVIKNAYNGREEAFFGIGEYPFYTEPLEGTSFTSDPWPAIFEYASEKGLFIMVHPTQQQANEISIMLSKYPNTKVILHGYELLGNPTLLENLLRNHKNLYWTYDTATMFDGYLYRIDNAADFTMWYKANKKQYLSSVRNKLLPLLEAAPDRVMWGTDVVAEWHVKPEVYSLLIEFSNELIESLPAQHKDNYAYANAQRIFDSGIVFEK